MKINNKKLKAKFPFIKGWYIFYPENIGYNPIIFKIAKKQVRIAQPKQLDLSWASKKGMNKIFGAKDLVTLDKRDFVSFLKFMKRLGVAYAL